jgi:hypothetical protein
VSATAAPAGTIWIVPPLSAGATTRPRNGSARPAGPGQRRRGIARRWQLAGLLIVVVTGAVVVLAASHGPPKPSAIAASSAAGSQRLASASALRAQAVDWVAAQVGHDVSVACDAATCSALAARGFPASNLTVVQPSATDPYGSTLVIATAAIRSQFGAKLGGAFAPQVIASFGTGANRIDVRFIAPLGAAAFRRASSADLAARKASGAELLQNSRVTVAASARSLLAAGLIDPRLLTTIAFLAGQHPLVIVGFGGASPGAGPVPLRSVYLAEADAAAHLTGSAYVQSLESVLQAQSPPYVPLRVTSVQFGGGGPVLEVEFAAPSPLGLLHS